MASTSFLYLVVYSITSSLILVSKFQATQAVNPHTIPRLFGTGNQICNYRYALPNGQNCLTFGPALEQKLDAVTKDLENAKLQYVAQNTILREELRKLHQQTSTTDTQVSDLTKEVKNLQVTLSTFMKQNNNPYTTSKPPVVATTKKPNGPNNNNNNNMVNLSMVQRLLGNTKQQLTQGVLRLENKMNHSLNSIIVQRQLDAVQQSKTDQALQSQLTMLESEWKNTQQKLQNLQSQIRAQPTGSSVPTVTVNPPQTSGPVTSTPASVNPTSATKLPQSTTPNPLLQLLDQRLAKLETEYHQTVPTLQTDVTSLQNLTANHTKEISNVKVEADYLQSFVIPQMKVNNTDLYKRLQFQATQLRALPALRTSMNQISKSVLDLRNQTSILAIGHLNLVHTVNTNLTTDETSIKDLKLQVAMLSGRLTSVQNQLHVTAVLPTHPPTPTPSTPAFKIPTPHNG